MLCDPALLPCKVTNDLLEIQNLLYTGHGDHRKDSRIPASQSELENWHHYQTKQNLADAYRVAQRRGESTVKRHRLVDDKRRLLDLIGS